MRSGLLEAFVRGYSSYGTPNVVHDWMKPNALRNNNDYEAFVREETVANGQYYQDLGFVERMAFEIGADVSRLFNG